MSIQNAKWILEESGYDAPLFQKKLVLSAVKSAVLEISTPGWGEVYLNGKPVSDALFSPPASNYEQVKGKRTYYPYNDTLTSTRVYYCRYEVTALLKEGENLLSVLVGNGFFNQKKRIGEGDFFVGPPRLCYSLQLVMEDGSRKEIQSDETTLAGKSYLSENNIYYGEVQDLSKREHLHAQESDILTPARVIPDFGAELTLFEGPFDRVIREVTPRLLGEAGGKQIYDVGENISGWIAFDTAFDGRIQMEFAEEITSDLQLDFSTTGGTEQIQQMTYLGDGKRHCGVSPRFAWQGFRYFSVVGEIQNPVCQVIHTELVQTGDFYCDNAEINLLLENYKRTQLTNLHGCIPSDCPHRERLGYTGDGQITCETVMHLWDAKALYRKWMRDITDAQGVESGHIQHTAPFYGGGGGPGGWGGAVMVLPYVYYKMYGEEAFVKENLSAMLRYLDYMESRCEGGLVTWEEKDGWCLGDWCFEGCDPWGSPHLPASYVNTCFLTKFYDELLELDGYLSLGLDRVDLQQKRQLHAKAVEASFARENGDYCEGTVGANAFALEIGLGDHRTVEHLVNYYTEMNGFDTGIFATELLLRILAERGYPDLVFRLLTSCEPNRSFGDAFRRGLTTIPEYWTLRESHNHPMYGGGLKVLFTCFLGIRNKGIAYDKVEISPADEMGLGNFHGFVTTPKGKFSVALCRKGDRVQISVTIPQGTEAVFRFRDRECTLSEGTNIFDF